MPARPPSIEEIEAIAADATSRRPTQPAKAPTRAKKRSPNTQAQEIAAAAHARMQSTDDASRPRRKRSKTELLAAAAERAARGEFDDIAEHPGVDQEDEVESRSHRKSQQRRHERDERGDADQHQEPREQLTRQELMTERILPLGLLLMGFALNLLVFPVRFGQTVEPSIGFAVFSEVVLMAIRMVLLFGGLLVAANALGIAFQSSGGLILKLAAFAVAPEAASILAGQAVEPSFALLAGLVVRAAIYVVLLLWLFEQEIADAAALGMTLCIIVGVLAFVEPSLLAWIEPLVNPISAT